MFKCAMLGCGNRQKGHARGYQSVERGKIVGICDLDEAKLNAFGDEFGISSRYTDVHEMLEKEQPDVLHITTIPGLRVPLMTLASDAGVPAAIVEKPIALWGEDWKQLNALSQATKTKFCVNTQLHFHAQNMALKQIVADGGIGQVRFIDCSAGSTPLDQGVHVLELAHSYAGHSPFVNVFGQVSGGNDLTSRQPSPDMCVAGFNFESGVTGRVLCGSCAPRASEHEARYRHKRCAVYGTEGFIHWTMYSWERKTKDGAYECGKHEYGEEDDLAQGRLTEAVFDWLDDDSKPHPTRLERSLAEFNAILGIYTSALEHRVVDLPFDPPDGLCAAMTERLS